MTLDKQLTERIRKWLDTEPGARDYDEGALLLLKLSGNRIMYRNITAAGPGRRAEFIEYQIKKYHSFRLAELTHAQVEEMSDKVEKIVEAELSLTQKAAENRTGRRPDHDSLPPNIQDLYTQNLGILQKMRQLHLKLRSLSLENSTCPDSERFPFLKEIIELDKRRLKNWADYDAFNLRKS